MKEYRAIGLMSGTSLDGIDAALLRTDGESRITREGFVYVPYAPEFREKLRACLGKPPDAAVARELTIAHAEAVKKLLAQQKTDSPDLIGFHGHTISHAPERGHTCQIGDGALLSSLTGIDVVNDFRSNDVKAGGWGAPLVPVYHQTIAANLDKPVAFLNIGGVANVTHIATAGGILAFDPGPGNALIDDWMLSKTGAPRDEDGNTARRGKVAQDVLDRLLSHPYFTKLPPKSLDRDAFASRAWEGLSPEDGAATLAAFTVQAIARSAAFMPEKPLQWIVCGGGRLNKFLMDELKKALSVPVAPIESLGLNGDATEAEAFAYLAVRSLRGLPFSFPGTTGVREPMTGGVLHRVKTAAA